MSTVKDVFDFLNGLYPVSMKMDFDNVGHLAGDSRDVVKKIIVSLDVTGEVISEAEKEGANLIISHHPLFFSLKSVTDLDPVGRNVCRLIRSGISAICMHTNLDAAEGGVNDALAKAAGIKEPELLCVEGTDEKGKPYCIGRMGELEKEMPMAEYLVMIKKALGTAGLRYYDSGRPVKRVGVVGGSGMSQIQYALDSGCDTFLTADIKYNGFLDAREFGYNVIDADHFCTENLIVPVLAEKLRERFEDIEVSVSQVHCQTVKFI